MDYTWQAIFSAIRVILVFLFIFGFVSPFFFSYASNKKGIDRIVYSWVGLGGLLTATALSLVLLNIFDFIGILFCLLMLPLLVKFFKRKWEGGSAVDIFNLAENKIIAKHVRFVEWVKLLSFKEIKKKLTDSSEIDIKISPYTFLAVGIAIYGSILRLLPALQNSAPFSRLWYFELDAVKSLSLQVYFDGYPEPKGMHSIINVFSIMTQVSPEMILHIIGGLVSFFLSIIIYWAIREITRGEYPVASLFGMTIYSIFPTLFLPVSLELETELSSLSLALCFALPTILFYLKKISTKTDIPWFYISMGIIATGLTDIFVLMMVLLPFFIFGLISLTRKNILTRGARIFLFVIANYLLVLSPYIIYCWLNNIDLSTYFQDQLYNTQVFSFAPNLIMPIEDLSIIYMSLGALLLTAYLIRHFKQNRKRFGDEIVFSIVFIIVGYIYTPYFNYQYILIDPDQLNSFFGIMISIFGGLLLYSITIFLNWIRDDFKKYTPYLTPTLATGMIIWFFIVQGGFQSSRALPRTQPNGFFNAYYKIIKERVPYTYATVGPDLDNGLAKNRHYFMNYQFFLKNYGAIDSLYQQYLTVPAVQRTDVDEVPPASIFLFLEKPPYGAIQQGILYDAQTTMRDMEQWLNNYQNLEGRELDLYYENDKVLVYEIINREGESSIMGVLGNIYPKEEGRAARLFR